MHFKGDQGEANEYLQYMLQYLSESHTHRPGGTHLSSTKITVRSKNQFRPWPGLPEQLHWVRGERSFRALSHVGSAKGSGRRTITIPRLELGERQ